jgi:hypothetical protein
MTAEQMLTIAVNDARRELADKKPLTPDEAKRQARRQRRAKARRELVGDVMQWLKSKPS